MDSERFDLVFSGELVRGADLAQAKSNLGKLFKISETKVDALFSGKPIALKKGLDFATANKYRVAIKKAGCRVDLVELEKPSAPAVEPATKTDPPSNTNQNTALENTVPENIAPENTAPQSLAEKTRSAAPVENKSDLPLPQVDEAPPEAIENMSQASKTEMQLAPVGSPVLLEQEKTETPHANIDVSQYSLSETGVDLLDDADKKKEVEFELDVHFSLAEVGKDLLDEADKSKSEAAQLDTSAFSLSEAGADLGQIKDDKEVKAPNTDHLSVE